MTVYTIVKGGESEFAIWRAKDDAPREFVGIRPTLATAKRVTENTAGRRLRWTKETEGTWRTW